MAAAQRPAAAARSAAHGYVPGRAARSPPARRSARVAETTPHHGGDLREGETLRLRMKTRRPADRARRDRVRRVMAATPASARSTESSMPVSARYSTCRGRGCVRRRARRPRDGSPLVEQHPKRHPPEVPRRRRLRRVPVAVGVQPDDAELRAPRREPPYRTDVRTATTPETSGGRAAGPRSRRTAPRACRARRRPCPGRGASSDAASAIASPPDLTRGARARAPRRRPSRTGGTRTEADRDRRERTAVGAACTQRGRQRSPAATPSSASARPVSDVSVLAGRGSAGSPSRLIQIAGMPSSAAGAMSWYRLWATCTYSPAPRGCARGRPPSAVPWLVRADLAGDDRRSEGHADGLDRRRRSGRGRCWRGSRAATSARARPTAPAGRRRRRATTGATERARSPRPPAAGAPSPPRAARGRRSAPPGTTTWGSRPGSPARARGSAPAGVPPLDAEELLELAADARVPVDERPVAVEGRPALRHAA